jgi:trk/ktr system potassium uptake protein
MKYPIVINTIGTVLVILGLLLVVPGIVATIYHEPNGVVAFALASLLALSVGLLMRRIGSGSEMSIRGAFVAVTLGWLAATLFGALPYIFQGIGIVDALFESISGFSATGATILTESNDQGYYIVNETLAQDSIANQLADLITINLADYNSALNPATINTYFGLLFWRSFQQFVGGLGIILLIVAIFPRLRVAGRQLYRAETVGPSKDTITPRAVSTARILWKVYVLFNVVEIILLLAAGMPLYDAICTAFSTLATGGFSPQATSLVAYNSPIIDSIVAVFIILGMSSFVLHYRVLSTDRFAWFKDEEFRFMVVILAIATLIIFVFGQISGDLLTRLRYASFQTISLMGTCGFVNTLDYNNWSTAAKLVLIMVMLIGGSIGSTAAGIKVGRLLVDLKYTRNELSQMLHPKAMLSVRIGSRVLHEDVLRSIIFYSFIYLATFLALSLALAMVSMNDPRVDLLVVTSGIASCMGGVGPAFGIIAFDWSQISSLGKLIGFFAMYIGRLELMPIFLLFLPDLWRN